MNLNPYIYILYYQSIYNIFFHPNPLVTLIKWNIVFVMEVLEQPGNETLVHNVERIHDLRHINIDKQSTLLADIDVTPPKGVV